MINPINVFALNSELWVTISATKDPIAAKGIENISTNGVEIDSKTEARIIKIRIKAARIRK
jgi:phosphomannomutase